jgi:XTP/dITP diphosphohydrolase
LFLQDKYHFVIPRQRFVLCFFLSGGLNLSEISIFNQRRTKDKEPMIDFQLLIATKNTGKIKEMEKLFSELPITLRSLKDFADVPEPEETGSTFAENAILKAKYYALQTKLSALADDSGLEVAALDGAPGVFSARYAGENADDSEKIEKLLNRLEATPANKRSARFICAMALADEKGEIKYLTEGICNGTIAFKSRGKNGFGYDPIFLPDGFSRTFGELSNEIKQEISHRARASEKIIEYLRGFITV